MSRSYLITWNNPPQDNKFDLEDHPDIVRYCIYQYEEVSTYHLQGYIELTKPVRISYLTKHYGNIHAEPRYGTREQAREYCSKEESRVDGPYEYGTWIKGQGHRTDLDHATHLIKELKTMKEIFDAVPSTVVKYSRGLQYARNLVLDDNTQRDVHVTIITGPPGTGKSRYVWNKHPNLYCVDPPMTSGQSVWFNGYDGQDVVLLDDFNGWISYTFMLRLLDRYPLRDRDWETIQIVLRSWGGLHSIS